MTTVFTILDPANRGFVDAALWAAYRGDRWDRLSPEWFLWFLTELANERPSILYLSMGRGPQYLQLVVDADGRVLAEVASNEVLPSNAQLDGLQERALEQLGWQPPTCGWPEPFDAPGFRSPNHWRRWDAPAPLGDIAMLLLGTLEEVFSVTRVGQLGFTFCRETEGRAGPHPHPHPEVANPLEECFAPRAAIHQWRAAVDPDDMEYLEWTRQGDNVLPKAYREIALGQRNSVP